MSSRIKIVEKYRMDGWMCCLSPGQSREVSGLQDLFLDIVEMF